MSIVYSHADYNAVLNARGEIEGLPLERLRLSMLACPTGRLVTSDPLACPDMPAFTTSVEPGRYPVDIFIVKTKASGYRIALACLTFSEEPAVSWPLALRDGQKYDELEEGSYFGFPVDAGLACFLDEQTLACYNEFLDDFADREPLGNVWDDYFADLFLANARDLNDRNDIGDWLDFHLPKSKEHNMAMFASGMGDGIYPTYWGESASGSPTHLVIDFHVVLLPEEETSSSTTEPTKD
ncbi:MAG: DUF4241 domain-containing protein [Verrucomicrobiota bacterium]